MIVITPATRHVEVRTASNGRPSSARSGVPAKPRIAGFTKMMYDMTTKVVAPERISGGAAVLLVSEDARSVRAKALTHATAKWDWLREAAGSARRAEAMVAGVLIAAERASAAASRDAWRGVWKALDKKSLRAWF